MKKARFYDDQLMGEVLIDLWQITGFTINRDGNGYITSYSETWDDGTETQTESATPTYDATGYVTSVAFDSGLGPTTLTITRDSNGNITGGS